MLNIFDTGNFSAEWIITEWIGSGCFGCDEIIHAWTIAFSAKVWWKFNKTIWLDNSRQVRATFWWQRFSSMRQVPNEWRHFKAMQVLLGLYVVNAKLKVLKLLLDFDELESSSWTPHLLLKYFGRSHKDWFLNWIDVGTGAVQAFSTTDFAWIAWRQLIVIEMFLRAAFCKQLEQFSRQAFLITNSSQSSPLHSNLCNGKACPTKGERTMEWIPFNALMLMLN